MYTQTITLHPTDAVLGLPEYLKDFPEVKSLSLGLYASNHRVESLTITPATYPQYVVSSCDECDDFLQVQTDSC